MSPPAPCLARRQSRVSRLGTSRRQDNGRGPSRPPQDELAARRAELDKMDSLGSKVEEEIGQIEEAIQKLQGEMASMPSADDAKTSASEKRQLMEKQRRMLQQR